jgi:hypothetical protein
VMNSLAIDNLVINRIACRVATSIFLGALAWISSPLALVNCAAQVQGVKTQGVKIRADGVLLKAGQPFFPVGFYHVSWHNTPTEQLQHLREIAAAGFNVVHASAIDLQSYETFLQEANRLGVSVISEHHVDPVSFVQRFKAEPAILAWNLADDVDNGRWSPDRVLTLHQQIQSTDPNHPTYISGYSKDLQQFVQCANVIGRQSYPIRQHTTAELSSTFSDMAEISSAFAGRPQHMLFANLQVFPWSAAPGQKGDVPTVPEVRNMTYQALLGGAKGILYYTYSDEAWYLPEHPELWNGLKTIGRELKSLSPWFLEGRYQPLKLTQQDLKAGVWVMQQRALLVAINTSQQQNLTEQVQNTWTSGQSIRPLADSLSVQFQPGKKLVLTLPANTVQIYEIY